MRRISEVIDRMISSNPNLTGLKLFSIKTAWEKTVGDVISKRARVVNFNGGIVFVLCKDPMWSGEISFKKKKIIEGMNRTLGKNIVRDVRIVKR